MRKHETIFRGQNLDKLFLLIRNFCVVLIKQSSITELAKSRKRKKMSSKIILPRDGTKINMTLISGTV